MNELKLDTSFEDIMQGVEETRNKMLKAASEHYDIPEDELERQINEIGDEVQMEHPEAFPFPLNP
jgi:hypothetical protein